MRRMEKFDRVLSGEKGRVGLGTAFDLHQVLQP